MDPSIRNDFKTKFMEIAEEHALGNIGINTYIRQIDSKMQISAIDMIYAISSILESPKNLSRKDFGNFLVTEEMKRQAETNQNALSSRASSIAVLNPVGKESEKDFNLEAAQECKYANFWVAYDALDKNNKNLLELGIELAKEL